MYTFAFEHHVHCVYCLHTVTSGGLPVSAVCKHELPFSLMCVYHAKPFAEKDSQVTKQSWLIHARGTSCGRHPYFCPHGANKCPTYSYLLLCCSYLGFFLTMLLFKMVPYRKEQPAAVYCSVIGYNVPNQIKSVKYPCSEIQLLVMSSISTKTQVHKGCVLTRWYNVCLKAHQILTA